jgi:hypothetical protein
MKSSPLDRGSSFIESAVDLFGFFDAFVDDAMATQNFVLLENWFSDDIASSGVDLGLLHDLPRRRSAVRRTHWANFPPRAGLTSALRGRSVPSLGVTVMASRESLMTLNVIGSKLLRVFLR